MYRQGVHLAKNITRLRYEAHSRYLALAEQARVREGDWDECRHEVMFVDGRYMEQGAISRR